MFGRKQASEAGATPGPVPVGAGAWPWLLLAPSFIVLFAVGVYPLLYSLWISLHDYHPTNPSFPQGFIGLDNYVKAFGDEQALHALGLTALFTFASVSLSLITGLGLALLLNARLPGLALIRALVLIPMLVTPIVVGITWRIMFNSELGVVNYLTGLVGLAPQPWLGSEQQALACVIFVDVWEWMPFMFLILFAGLRSLPKSPFEAAAIDGAGRFRVFFSITLPMLQPVIVLAVLLRGVDAARTFDQVFMMTRGGPNLVTDFASLYLQRVNFKFFDVGYGAALSWLFLLLLLLAVIAFIRYTGFVRHVAQEAPA
ncbi:MAG TPA: sugar ABC transporter permease [Alphaproteobacteria bacterium]|nr:sugar ABC transporter permease [Alphaproteobacteria bacterium]